MKRRIAISAILLGSALFSFPVLMQGQNGAARPAAAAYTPARTPWGDPDIQGTYTNKDENGTPMARPRDLAGKSLADYGPKEMAALNQQRLERARSGAGRIGGSAAEDTGAGPSHWYEHLDAQNSQPWLIFDPPEGTIPPAKPSAQKRQTRFSTGCRGSITNSYEDCSLYDRCITRGLPGSMTPAIYGNAYDITQGPGWVAIRYEMIHETRVIPLDGRPRLPSAIKSYMGEPRGRWEGNALVVETTNFRPGSVPQNGSDELKLIERFIPINARTLRWEVRFDDPQTWDRSWAYAMPLKRDNEQAVVEYACHEGNRGLENILRASRVEEAAKK
jgi:hypothetical protein